MQRIDTVPYTVGQHFALYIAYGETEHLTDSELADFKSLESAAKTNASEGFEFSHWSIAEDTDEFAHCEATYMMGACIIVEAVYFHREA